MACQVRTWSQLMLLRITGRNIQSFCKVKVIRWDTTLTAVNLIRHFGEFYTKQHAHLVWTSTPTNTAPRVPASASQPAGHNIKWNAKDP